MVPFFPDWQITICSSQMNPFPLFEHKGAPQGCTSSLYSNNCTSTTSGNFTVIFADDTAILSLLFAHSNIDTYFSAVNRFTEWCTDNFLERNIKIK